MSAFDRLVRGVSSTLLRAIGVSAGGTGRQSACGENHRLPVDLVHGRACEQPVNDIVTTLGRSRARAACVIPTGARVRNGRGSQAGVQGPVN
jgi:hypothetical protein